MIFAYETRMSTKTTSSLDIIARPNTVKVLKYFVAQALEFVTPMKYSTHSMRGELNNGYFHE